MEQVFAFGQVTFVYTFTNREIEKQRLLNNIKDGRHTVLISQEDGAKVLLLNK